MKFRPGHFEPAHPGESGKHQRKPRAAPVLQSGVASDLPPQSKTAEAYSHSIVPGGLLVMSKTQRLTPFTSLMMRVESFSKIS